MWINPEDARPASSDAFERILIAHERMVLRVSLRMLGNVEDAQDAAQEVFLKLHKNLKQFDPAQPFEPWLYRMTVNVCLDVLRKRRPVEPLDQVGPMVAAEAETGLLERERASALQRALDRLPQKERAALVLREVEGLTTREVAAALESSETTVRSQICQARLKLRKLLGRGT